MEEEGSTCEKWGTRSPQAALSSQGPQPRRDPAPSAQEARPHRRAAPSSVEARPRRNSAPPAQEQRRLGEAAISDEGPRRRREDALPAQDPAADAQWWMESPASSPSSPGRAGCTGRCVAVPSEGDAVLKKRRLLQASRRAPVEGGERKEQRGQWWKKVEIGVDFVPDSQGGTDDDLVFVSASDASQIGDGSVAVKGKVMVKLLPKARVSFNVSERVSPLYRHWEIMNKYYGGIDRLHMLDGSRDVDDSQETMDEQLLLEDDSQAVDDDVLLDDQLLVEDDSQAVEDHELLDDQLLIEDDSQAVDDDELLLIHDDSQLTRSGSMFKSSKFGPAPSSPCAAPPSPDSSGAPSASCTGELLRSKNPGPSGVEEAPSPGGVQGPPSPCAAVGMASSSR
ncbi:hypothetical protein EJB05_24272, partial [Eragrostis curvula]